MSTPAVSALIENIGRVFIGNPDVVQRAVACLLARGHLLIEDVPGVGKTVLATAIAQSVDCHFSRIQLTPDLLPSDVLGVSIYNRDSGEFEFKKGPIFANIVLADEINRTTPRTQSALLESMSEATVSVEGRTHPLEPPFMVIATQNPYEFEGTYPLPENQLDRFLMQIHAGYPSPEDEARVLEERPGERALKALEPALSRQQVVELQNHVDTVRVERTLLDYIVEIARATREHPELQVGLSPRGSLALAQAARAHAVMNARDYCVPDDIAENILPVCAHRVVPRGGIHGAGTRVARDVIQQVAHKIPSPV